MAIPGLGMQALPLHSPCVSDAVASCRPGREAAALHSGTGRRKERSRALDRGESLLTLLSLALLVFAYGWAGFKAGRCVLCSASSSPRLAHSYYGRLLIHLARASVNALGPLPSFTRLHAASSSYSLSSAPVPSPRAPASRDRHRLIVFLRLTSYMHRLSLPLVVTYFPFPLLHLYPIPLHTTSIQLHDIDPAAVTSQKSPPRVPHRRQRPRRQPHQPPTAATIAVLLLPPAVAVAAVVAPFPSLALLQLLAEGLLLVAQ